jgi:uncharacterized protein (TIGR03435 family)
MLAPVMQAQDAGAEGSRFFRTTITRNAQPLLAEALFNDTEGNTIVMGAPLIAVISKAYDLPTYRIVDGPAWIHTSHLYDIEAVPPPAFIDSSETLMLQNLLKDQFGFEASMATREISALALELEGDKFNLESVIDSAHTGVRIKLLPDSPDYDMSVTFTLDELALATSKALNQVVINLSGLQGRYRINMNRRSKTGSLPLSNLVDPTGLYERIIEASGLHVQQKLLPIDVLVVKKIVHPKLAN